MYQEPTQSISSETAPPIPPRTDLQRKSSGEVRRASNKSQYLDMHQVKKHDGKSFKMGTTVCTYTLKLITNTNFMNNTLKPILSLGDQKRLSQKQNLEFRWF